MNDNFRLLPRSLFNSRAFAALSKGGIVVVLAILDKLEYENKGYKDRKGVTIGLPVLRNGGEFVLTTNELVARGLSASTATRGRNEAWQLGFFDVIEQGSLHHAGRYRYSERWRHYPNGPYRPTGQQPPGKNLYPDHGFKKRNDSDDDNSQENVIFTDFVRRR